MESPVNKFVTLAALAAMSTSVADAASNEELAEIRAQLQALLERVDRLEEENVALRNENEALKAQGDRLNAEVRDVRQEASAKTAKSSQTKDDWTSKVKLKGDLRYRYEYVSDEQVKSAGQTADRYRDRIRARLGLEAQATDHLVVGLGLATADDPRSTNQSLDNVFSRKSFGLDLAYFDWQFADWGNLIGGKMKQPFLVPGDSVFWDRDINPEGLAFEFAEGIWFGSAYGFWIDEISGPQSTRTSDVMLYGGQIGVKVPVGAASLTVAAHYYDLSGGVGRAPFYEGDPNGNTTVVVGGVPVLVYDYRIVDLMAELNMKFGQTPFQFWLDVAQNQDPKDNDMAWSAGVQLGKASGANTWQIGTSYQKIEKDALFGQLIHSDFGDGDSDSEGWIFSGGYAPARNWTLNATYFLNRRNVDAGTKSDFDRLQLDLNVKF
jgi:uncharacterized protein (UPF0335 family)